MALTSEAAEEASGADCQVAQGYRAVVSHVQLCQRHCLSWAAAAANVASAHQQHQDRMHAPSEFLRHAMHNCLRALLHQASGAGHDEQHPDRHKRTGPQPSLP